MLIFYNGLAFGLFLIAFVIGLVVNLVMGDRANFDLIIGSLSLVLMDIACRVLVTVAEEATSTPQPTGASTTDPAATNAFMKEVFGPQASALRESSLPQPLWKRLLFPSFGGHVMFLPVWCWGLLSAYIFWK